jgi:hypothetical protein
LGMKRIIPFTPLAGVTNAKLTGLSGRFIMLRIQ